MAVRANDGSGPSMQLMNEAGEVTSHILGMWYRTLKFLESGIRPAYVFDGKPPVLKSGELAKRQAAKEKATKELGEAQEAGNTEDVDRFARRTVRMDKTHVEDCKRLLRLMGMPVVEAPCEAEAQCAALAKAGKVYAAASEDMDTLTFGSPRLVRKLWASEAAKIPVLEIDLEKALAGLELTYPQFIDVCILAGCDYCEPIKGIAATTAYRLVKKENDLMAVIASLDQEKHPVPKDCDYQQVRDLFLKPEVLDPETVELKWGEPDKDGLLKFLVEEKGFNAQRIESGIAKLMKARQSGQQLRMDSFFKAIPSAPTTTTISSSTTIQKKNKDGTIKRKGDKNEKDGDNKKKK